MAELSYPADAMRAANALVESLRAELAETGAQRDAAIEQQLHAEQLHDDLAVDLGNVRSAGDEMRAALAEWQPRLLYSDRLRAATEAWRSVRGDASTEPPAERSVSERPWRVMADWDTVIGAFRTRAEAEHWRDRSRVAHHPNAYLEPEWAPPRVAPAAAPAEPPAAIGDDETVPCCRATGYELREGDGHRFGCEPEERSEAPTVARTDGQPPADDLAVRRTAAAAVTALAEALPQPGCEQDRDRLVNLATLLERAGANYWTAPALALVDAVVGTAAPADDTAAPDGRAELAEVLEADGYPTAAQNLRDRVAAGSDRVTTDEIARWDVGRFGGRSPVLVALKLAEEAGEVCGAVIKRDEGAVRPAKGLTSREDWTRALHDEIGDVAIALHALCGREGVTLDDLVRRRFRDDVALRTGQEAPAGQPVRDSQDGGA